MEPRPLAGKLLLLLVTCLETIWSLLSPALVTPPKKKETYTHTNKQNPFLFMEGLQFSCNNRTKAVWGNKEEECGQTRVCCWWLLWSPMMGGHGFPGAAAAKLVGAAHHMSSFTCWAMQQRGFGLKSPSHKPTWNNFTILQVKSEFLSPFFACCALISVSLSYRQLLILIYIIKSIVSLDQKFCLNYIDTNCYWNAWHSFCVFVLRKLNEQIFHPVPDVFAKLAGHILPTPEL